MTKAIKSDSAVLIAFFVITLSVVWLYNVGVNEFFYFDDYINLNALENVGGVNDWGSAKQYIFGNTSGRTGRPVSMASFLLNDNAWPSMAASFKQTNIWLHALTGLLLFWFVFLLVRISSNSNNAAYVAFFVAAVWMVNPFHVSTVLYPVQRMAQLPTIFSLLSMIFYLKARCLLFDGQTRIAVLLFSLVGLFFVAGVYSKENGALIPLFIVLVELWLSHSLPWRDGWLKRMFWALSAFAILVIAFVIGYSVYNNGLFEVYPGRDFTPYQRLITQPSIILFYMKELFFPSLYTSGLYYDDWSALASFRQAEAWVSSLIIVILIWASVLLFKRRVYSGFAILFFFAGHILESTALNLELVFEHRNYLPSLFLGFVWLDVCATLKRFSSGVYLLLAIPLVIFPVFAFDRSSLWASKLEFSAYLVENRPQSVRSHVELNNALLYYGMVDEAQSAVDEALKVNPDSGYLAIHAVLVDCIAGESDPNHMANLIDNAGRIGFDGRNALAFERLYDFMESKRCDFITPGYIDRLFVNYLRHAKEGNNMVPASNRMLQVYADRFYISYPEYSPDEIKRLSEVLENNDPEYLMSIAAQVANIMRYKEALILSERALELVRQGVLGGSSRTQDNLEKNIIEFQKRVKSDIND